MKVDLTQIYQLYKDSKVAYEDIEYMIYVWFF